MICGFDSWLASLLLFYCCEFGILLCVNCVLISVVNWGLFVWGACGCTVVFVGIVPCVTDDVVVGVVYFGF